MKTTKKSRASSARRGKAAAPVKRATNGTIASRVKPAGPGLRRPPPNRPIAVVGVGASAGGFEAFRQLIATMPDDTGLAFVLIQHLDPTHASLTSELMRRHTKMPVIEARQAMRIDRDRVYVIPPNRYLAIQGGRLRLSEPAERRGLRVPIDFFFRSLAADQQRRAIAIILSGTGTDGTLGVREVKAAGGLVLVQAPETARHDGMCRSAVATGAVDFVVPVEHMASVLTRYVRHWYVDGASPPAPLDRGVSDQIQAIIGLLREMAHFDFSGYKKGTLSRRIHRRMGLHHIEKPEEYVALLRDNEAERKALHGDLLIGVTSFFREPRSWQALVDRVLQPLARDHGDGLPIRAWVPGCATGEEAYSAAMLLIETCEAAGRGTELQVFASDIDGDALGFARGGIYPESIAADVSGERLRRFFTKSGHFYRVGKGLRDAVVFAEQNVFHDPPFSKLDLISCRNVLIYLEPEVQRRVLSLFHFGLRESGFLFLGGSETITQRQDLFSPIGRGVRIFRRRDVVPRDRVEIPMPAHMLRREIGAGTGAQGAHPRRAAGLGPHLLLQRYAPACVLINAKAEVLYLNGAVGHYLQLPAGEPTTDLFSMAREGMRSRLRSAVARAIAERKTVAVAVAGFAGSKGGFRIVVEPLRDAPAPEGLFLVAFEDVAVKTDGRGRRPARTVATSVRLARTESEEVIRRLEEDVRATREDLRTTIEELQTSNEEFKGANEEVISINEELQSTNEELESSKEELESLNEELQTVNSQLELKLAELEASNNDLKNMFSSTDLATIFLDRELRIRRFTPGTHRLLPVIEADLGRPLAHLTHSFTDQEMLADASRALQTLTPVERETGDHEGRWYLRRTAPYRTHDDQIEGVVITFADVTTVKAHEQSLRELNEELRQRVIRRNAELRRLIEASSDSMVVVNAEGTIVDLNPRTEEVFGWSRDELMGQPVEMLMPKSFRAADGPDRARYLETRFARPMGAGLDLFGRRKDGSEFAIEVQLSPMELDNVEVVVVAIRDVTERKMAESTRNRLAAIVESTSAAILLVDLDGTIQTWNRGAEHLFGYTAEEVLGRSIAILMPSERRDEFRDNLERLKRGEHVEDFETVRLDRQGGRVDVALTVSLVEDNRVSRVCAIHYDIRPRKELEQRMAELMEEERQRIGRELHDTLGQQVTAVGMMVSSLKTQLGPGSPHAVAVGHLEQTVEQSKGQLRALIAGVFPVSVDAERLSWGLRDLSHETSRRHGLTCVYEDEHVLPVGDDFAATQLFLIAREAVHNAVRHARPNQIVIRLDGDGETRLSVADDGQGMPPPVEKSTTMGLRIMRYRTGLIGGRLEITPRPGGGTVVTVSLAAGQKR